VPGSNNSLLTICRECGLEPPADFIVTGLGPVVTAAGERKLLALSATDAALARKLLDATGDMMRVMLATQHLPRRLRRKGERLLRNG
jgi:hypothetical protein